MLSRLSYTPVAALRRAAAISSVDTVRKAHGRHAAGGGLEPPSADSKSAALPRRRTRISSHEQEESNPRLRIWNPWPYHWTMPIRCCVPRRLVGDSNPSQPVDSRPATPVASRGVRSSLSSSVSIRSSLSLVPQAGLEPADLALRKRLLVQSSCRGIWVTYGDRTRRTEDHNLVPSPCWVTSPCCRGRPRPRARPARGGRSGGDRTRPVSAPNRVAHPGPSLRCFVPGVGVEPTTRPPSTGRSTIGAIQTSRAEESRLVGLAYETELPSPAAPQSPWSESNRRRRLTKPLLYRLSYMGESTRQESDARRRCCWAPHGF